MIQYFPRDAERGAVVYYGLVQFDMTSCSTCVWIVPGTIEL